MSLGADISLGGGCSLSPDTGTAEEPEAKKFVLSKTDKIVEMLNSFGIDSGRPFR